MFTHLRLILTKRLLKTLITVFMTTTSGLLNAVRNWRTNTGSLSTSAIQCMVPTCQAPSSMTTPRSGMWPNSPTYSTYLGNRSPELTPRTSTWACGAQHSPGISKMSISIVSTTSISARQNSGTASPKQTPQSLKRQ